jgi:hypothetical protein
MFTSTLGAPSFFGHFGNRRLGCRSISDIDTADIECRRGIGRGFGKINLPFRRRG